MPTHEDRLTNQAREVLDLARGQFKDNSGFAGTLWALAYVTNGIAAKALASLGVTDTTLPALFTKVTPNRATAARFSNRIARRFTHHLLDLSYREARELGDDYIGTEHLLLGLLQVNDVQAHQALAKHARPDQIREKVSQYLRGLDRVSARQQAWTVWFRLYSSDVSEAVARGIVPRAFGRDKEIERIWQVLSRKSRNCPLLIGPPGVGKTSVVTRLGKKVFPSTLSPLGIRALDLPAMAAASNDDSDCQERLRAIAYEARAGNHSLLFIDDLDKILSQTNKFLSLAGALASVLADGKVQLIATATPDGYRNCIEPMAALARHFQPIQVPELTELEIAVILRGLCGEYETHHRVIVTDEALSRAAWLTDGTQPVARWLEAATGLIDEASARVRLNRHAQPPDPYEFNRELADVRRHKEMAIGKQDYETAATLRSTEKQLIAKRADRLAVLRADQDSQVTAKIVNEVAVQNMWLPSPARKPGIPDNEPPAPRKPRLASAPGDDPEFWSMI